MARWNSALCETNGINLHYTRTGPGKPSLLLLHGLMANGLCWTDIARALENEYDVIMPDFRGHGKSSVPDFGYRYEDHAKDIAGLVHNLGIDRPILIGHSMGGLVAAMVASLYPASIRGLILADPAFLSSKQQREVRDGDVADQHRRQLHQPLEEIVKDLQTRRPNRSLPMVERIARARRETSMSAFDVLTPPNPDYKQLVSSLEIPCLLIIGDAGIISEKSASDLQLIHPKLQVAHIQDAGHGIFYDQPERFSVAVRSFLRSLDRPVPG